MGFKNNKKLIIGMTVAVSALALSVAVFAPIVIYKLVTDKKTRTITKITGGTHKINGQYSIFVKT